MFEIKRNFLFLPSHLIKFLKSFDKPKFYKSKKPAKWSNVMTVIIFSLLLNFVLISTLKVTIENKK